MLLTILHQKNNFQNKEFLYLIEIPISNSAKYKMKCTVCWFRYSTTPNVTTLYTESSQAINFAFIFWLQTWPDHILNPTTQTSFHTHLSVIVTYLISVYHRKWRISIADSGTFHLNLTWSLTNHWPRASFPLILSSRGLHCHLSPVKDMMLRWIFLHTIWKCVL